MSSLPGRTVSRSGGVRGIGSAIMERLRAVVTNSASIAQPDYPHPTLPGPIHRGADTNEAAGDRALPTAYDVRRQDEVHALVARTVEWFTGVGICTNASAINLNATWDLPLSHYDLTHQANSRGGFVVDQGRLPHQVRSDAYFLTLGPPLSNNPRWLSKHASYALAKEGRTMIALGLAADRSTIAGNRQWPRTTIHAVAVMNVLGGGAATVRFRSAQIMAGTAEETPARPPSSRTGKKLIDDQVLVAPRFIDLTPDDADTAAAAEDLTLDLFNTGPMDSHWASR
jgi:citronellol/citronellal dehydrogenase